MLWTGVCSDSVWPRAALPCFLPLLVFIKCISFSSSSSVLLFFHCIPPLLPPCLPSLFFLLLLSLVPSRYSAYLISAVDTPCDSILLLCLSSKRINSTRIKVRMMYDSQQLLNNVSRLLCRSRSGLTGTPFTSASYLSPPLGLETLCLLRYRLFVCENLPTPSNQKQVNTHTSKHLLAHHVAHW